MAIKMEIWLIIHQLFVFVCIRSNCRVFSAVVEVYMFGHLPAQLTAYIMTVRFSPWTLVGQF